ncbi:receptor-type tyrosine-protein phosphatase N2 [Microplitis demolitor]|uniref:receptor-type tyrosine-protein phosphatase N2 n=1 Tax=Microplitis demolitor TaxID=69319 RepID=UPI0004CDC1C4|nr:receptor-type tyrosine-protein phosphatase N2 [Microplitis demolitor]XP_053598991.1 receptor-type tyrosine-protein phosphatase N2 [Microplitis demolitor]
MGRKKWWKGGSSLLLLVFIFINKQVVHSDGEIGCLFDRNVCASAEESCFDDAAFGRCIPSVDVSDEDVYQYNLDPRQLELLRKQLEKLVADKYEWSHPYTQCVMQNALYSIRNKFKHDSKICRKLKNFTEKPLADLVDESETDDILPLAVVNFMPTRGHGYGDFANEKYYPPVLSELEEHSSQNIQDYPYDPYLVIEEQPERHPTLNFENNNNNNEQLIFEPDELNQINKYDDEELYEISRKLDELERQRKVNAAKETTIFRSRRQPHDEIPRSLGAEVDDYLEYLKDSTDKYEDADEENDGEDKNDSWFDTSSLRKSNNERVDKSTLKDLARMEFLKNDRAWDGLRDEESTDDKEEDDEKESEEIEEILNKDNAKLLKNNETPEENSGIYFEGGFIKPLNYRNIYEKEPDNINIDDLPSLIWNRELSGFKRPERLDVKKPGPYFSTNNFAFKTQTSSSIEDEELADNEEVLRAPLVKKELIAGKDITRLSLEKDPAKYDNVDMDHVYIQFKEEFHKWAEGKEIVDKIEELLGLNSGAFSNPRVGRAEVTFKVFKNSRNMNPMEVVSQLDNIRGKLRETMNVNIIKAGIGDKIKLPPMLEITNVEYSMSSMFFAGLVIAGVTAAAAAAIITLIIARRHAKTRAKLAGLATPDPEASNDYQELCRARMHAKQPPEKVEVPRVAKLSKESESNRSSTSSWGGEEAAALSNMDISTGHMVLSYMEDHLKNKDRLDKEWEAICAYQPDPSSTAIAANKANANRNRPCSVHPYDHSRVVLNDLTNISNSDYINASTITDHDPRNPAYIATQGPLPQTSADFWQLVWEQGSVVIVMLTRLTEEGRAMCHRYWPEEGSELYHIYEVHLVSEHIWCDDYLVRSFYLKNLRTGETRTVTQFHFLSWPENGIPQSTKSLLEFRRKVNKSYRGRSCPIVVHCSDGAGRTGTYCLIDMVLNRMAKGTKEIDIAAALEHIRDQRPGMVATKQQFEFVLVAVAEEVHAILKALPVQTEKSTDKTNNSPPPTTGTSTTTSGQ